MSRWIRGIYNATANFNLCNALRATSGRFLDRNTEQLRKECNKPNEREQSSQPSKSNCSASSCTAATCTCTRATASSGRTSSSCGTSKTRNIPAHVSGCICSLCRDYNDYNEHSASIRTEGQGAGARIRVGNELKSFKHSNNGTTNDVEYITGIQSGVTI